MSLNILIKVDRHQRSEKSWYLKKGAPFWKTCVVFFFDLPVFLCSRAVACVVKLRSESVHSDQGGTAKGIRTASLPSGNRCGSERSTRTPSTISTIPIQSVGTRCFLPPRSSPGTQPRTGSLTPLSRSLPEHLCRPDQPGCDVLRQYILASVVPQPGAAPEPL